MFTHYYFEGPEEELFSLRTRLNDIFKSQSHPPSERDKELAALGFVRDDGSHDLVHILDALEGSKAIWHNGSVCGDIGLDACRSCETASGPWP